LAELAARRKDDAAWYNAGTAALADSDAETAQASLAHAAASLDPDVRFRALYNLGLLALRQAEDDSAGRDAHLADAERAYREALLLRPRDRPAKWNLELAVRQRGGSSQNKAPPSSGGGSGPSGGGARSAGGTEGGLSPAQAEQLLRSIGHEELRTRRDRTGLMRHPAEPGVKDW
jgi:tetratricopeptide (TPR) repeat protein